jgi:hypothetical protein
MSPELLDNPLFQQRGLDSAAELGTLAPIFPGSKPVDRIYLLAPAHRGPALAERFSIPHDKHGAYFDLESGIDLRRFQPGLLPFFARPCLVPFLTDLTPAQSWGGSLGALLMSSSIESLAETSRLKFGSKCYMCGCPRWSDKAPSHPARAWYSFLEPRGEEAFARQYLLALTPMCNDCETMFNIGPDAAPERLEASMARLATAFRYSDSEVEEYAELVRVRRDFHSRYLWAVDGSRVFGDATVSVQAAWSHRSEVGVDYPVLFRPSGFKGQPASAILCGVRYQVSDSHRIQFNP